MDGQASLTNNAELRHGVRGVRTQLLGQAGAALITPAPFGSMS